MGVRYVVIRRKTRDHTIIVTVRVIKSHGRYVQTSCRLLTPAIAGPVAAAGIARHVKYVHGGTRTKYSIDSCRGPSANNV